MWGAPHPITDFRFCTISCATGKRRGQTQVFPLLLISLLFLAVVRRFSTEKRHGHSVTADIRLGR